MNETPHSPVLNWMALIAGVIGLIALGMSVTQVRAHSWYDGECCSEKDCKPVEDGTVEERADGVHVKGFGVVPYSDYRLRWSRDDQDHVCVSQITGALLCVYRKPKGY